MAIAGRLKGYLDSRGICYELVHHEYSATSLKRARAAGIPQGRIAKSVLLEDEHGYLLVLLPASCRLEIGQIRARLHRELELATEQELAALFEDCAFGAVPAIGPAYGVQTLIDDSLLRMPDLYFESGDHEDLVHLSGMAFRALLAGAPHERCRRPH